MTAHTYLLPDSWAWPLLDGGDVACHPQLVAFLADHNLTADRCVSGCSRNNIAHDHDAMPYGVRPTGVSAFTFAAWEG